MSDSPDQLIDPLWHGARTVELRTRQLQEILLHYSPEHLHMRNGRGHNLKHRRIGPGVYSLWLEETP